MTGIVCVSTLQTRASGRCCEEILSVDFHLVTGTTVNAGGLWHSYPRKSLPFLLILRLRTYFSCFVDHEPFE